GAVDSRRVAQHRTHGLAEIARKDEPPLCPPGIEVDLDDRRAEDVPRIAEAAAEARPWVHLLVVADRPQPSETGARLLDRVERHRTPAAPAAARSLLPVRPLRLLLLNEGGIEQHHAQKLDRGLGGVDRS